MLWIVEYSLVRLENSRITKDSHTPLNDLAGDVAFQWEMGIKAIDALATLLEPMFWPDITKLWVMEPLAETHNLLAPYSNMKMLVDELDRAIFKILWVHHRGVG